MQSSGKVYGYLTSAREDFDLLTGLQELVINQIDALAKSGLLSKPTRPLVETDVLGAEGTWDGQYFYNNFEVAYVPFWRSPAYSSLFDALDKNGGFVSRRFSHPPFEQPYSHLLENLAS